MPSAHRGRTPFGLMLFTFCVLSITASGCATRQTGKAQPSGFLGDYSQLQPGGKGQAQLLYINPDADWKKYNAVLIDTPQVWLSGDSSKLSKRDEKMLTDKLHDALVGALEKNYQIVDQPGPNTLRIRTAITEARGANLLLNAATGLVPQLRVITMLGGMATDTAVLVGKSSGEVSIEDSTTGKRLAAAVDERVGTKDPRNMLNKWDDVDSAFKEWADRLAKKLQSLRGT